MSLVRTRKSPSSNRSHKPTVNFLRAYKFGDNEKDPIIDRIRTIFDDEGMSIYDSHKAGGPSVTAMHNWFEGETRRPQYATICAAARSAGYDFALVKTKIHVNGKDVEATAPRIVKSATFVRG